MSRQFARHRLAILASCDPVTTPVAADQRQELRSDSASPETDSPFLHTSETEWIASNDAAFAIYDGYPVSPGHALVITKRVVATWFEATLTEQAAVMSLVNVVKEALDQSLFPKP